MDAQTKKVETSLTAGYGLNFATAGYGGHVGLNFYAKKLKRTKVDVQISANWAQERDSDFSYFAANALVGGRYYLVDPENKTAVYINALLGLAFTIENGDDFIEVLPPFGYSAGIFVDRKRFLLGVSVENYQSVFLKVGYIF